MSRNVKLPTVIRTLKEFRQKPNDPDVQVALADMCRRFPIAVTMLAMEMYDVLLLNTPDYFTLRKADTVVKAYTNQQLADYIKANGGDDGDGPEAADGEPGSENEPVGAGAGRRRRSSASQNQTPSSQLDLDSLLSDEQ